MGLLGDNWDDPRTMGTLGLAASLLAASGPSRSPNNLGAGLLGGLSQYQDTLAQAKKMKMLEAEAKMREQEYLARQEEAARQRKMQQVLADAWQRRQVPGLQAGEEIPGTGDVSMKGRPAGFDTAGFVRDIGQVAPMKAFEIMQEIGKAKAPIKLGADEKLLDPNDYSVLAQGAPKQEAQPELIKLQRALMALPPGHPDRMMIEARISKLVRDNPGVNVSVSMDKGFGDVFAKQAAEFLGSSKGAAEAAQSSRYTLKRMNDALKSGNVLTGPGATWRAFGLRIGDMMGVSGNDAQEKLSNTRQLIQGSAALGLDGAKAMQGQGQVSNFERDLVQRASSGDIDSMTANEFKTLIDVLDRVHQRTISMHNQRLNQIPPEFSKFKPMYELQQPTSSPQSIDDIIKKYEGR